MTTKLNDVQMKQAEERFTPSGDFTPLPQPIPDGEIPINRLLREAGIPLNRLPDQGAQLAIQALLVYKRAKNKNKAVTIYQVCQVFAELVNTKLKLTPPTKATIKRWRKERAQKRESA